MKGVCHCCGCEFDKENHGDADICPDCAADQLKDMDSFLREYYDNLEVYRKMDQEFLQSLVWEEYFYSNTYPVFMKLMNVKCEGEALSNSVNRALVEAGVNPGDFFKMDYRSARKRFNGARKICYKYLCHEVKNIFQNGKRSILEENADKAIQLYEVTYQGYCYAFIVDHHEKKKVVILTDFYRPWERGKEDILLTSTYGKAFVEINDSVNYRMYRSGSFVIINTYNAFCKYARHLGKDMNLGFNEILFDDAIKEIDEVFRCVGDVNERKALQKFSFVVFRNIIIIYQFLGNCCCNQVEEV